MADKKTWLILIYKVPSEPTRLRATVWRRLKALGAVYLQNSVASLPLTPEAERALRSLRNEIVEMGGTAQLLQSEALVGAPDIVELFNSSRDEEYAEIVDRCGDFLEEVDRETKAQKFTYAELEEIDEDLIKLKGWLVKVRARDTLGASWQSRAVDALARCEAAFEEFTNCVYGADPDH